MPKSAPSPDRPLRRDAERNRQRILEVARDAFREDGLAVTLDEIARRAGLGVGTIYRRFRWLRAQFRNWNATSHNRSV